MVPDVIISIVSYCQKNLLDRCLTQILTLALPCTWQTVVVDNNSSDGSADMVAEKHPWVELIRLKQNLGFAGGHNIVYARTNSTVFVVLNPDVFVLPKSLETLVRALNHYPKAAVVGPCLLNSDGSFQFSARRFYNWRTVLLRRLPIPGRDMINDYHLMKDQDPERLRKVDWVLGAAMAIRRAAFPRSYLFDVRYKLYFEDVDLCYFAGREGWQVLYCPDAKMIHDHQRKSAKTFFNSATICHFSSWVKFYLKAKWALRASIDRR